MDRNSGLDGIAQAGAGKSSLISRIFGVKLAVRICVRRNPAHTPEFFSVNLA